MRATAARIEPLRTSSRVANRARAPRRRRARAAAASTIGDANESTDAATAYDVLGVRENATKDEIRRAFLRMSKTHHPDVRQTSGDDDGMMAKVNSSYAALFDDDARRKYDAKLRESRKGDAKMKRASDGVTAIYEGLVGPIVNDEMASLDVCKIEECAVDAAAEMIDSIRQWARTLAFTSELPLPLPVSVDDLPTGARLAFMRYDSSQGLREAGALRLEVLETSEGTKVSVSRSFAKASRAAKFEIPGEGRVMSAFMQEFKFLLGEDEKRTRKVDEASDDDFVSAFKSAFAAFILPGLPMFGATKSAPGGAYNAYNLKHDAKHID
jgi:curved DNA-binding protein CbpA